MQGRRSPRVWFSAQKELLCRGRMQLWTSSWSTSVQEGYQDIYSKLYLFIYICRSNLLFCIWAFASFFFYLFFSLFSKVKGRLLVSRYFTLHSNSNARRPRYAERPPGRSSLWCASLCNKHTVAQRKNLIASRWKLKSSGPLMITQHSTLDKALPQCACWFTVTATGTRRELCCSCS